MRNFARKLIEGPPELPIIKEINDSNVLDDIIFIIAYNDVVNPRKMIGLINSFITDYSIAKIREESENSLMPGVITNDLRPLAVLTVLKNDFPFAYEDLIKVPRLLEYIKYSRIDEIPDFNIQSKYSNESYEVTLYPNKNDLNALFSFIYLLAPSWLSKDFLPYLYLTLDKSFDEISSVIDNSREFDKAIRDYDFETVKLILDEIPD
ncbi:MAG TPA: hypothetical protein PKL31_13035 [Fulvivirga sp.]|nr:hypothetical protein [Fulvivirga sp.]